MPFRPTLKAVAFLLNGAVFLIGYARFQGRLAPPDYIYVGLLFAAPLANTAALVFGFRKAPDPEVMATLKAGALLLNLLLFAFVVWLVVMLPPEARSDEAIWLVLLFVAPFANTGALLLTESGPSHRDRT